MFHAVVGTVTLVFLALIWVIWDSESDRLRYYPKTHYRWDDLRKQVYDMAVYTIASALFVEAVYWVYCWIVSQWA